MSTELTLEDVEHAIVGGMLLSAGGSGQTRVAKDRMFGALACRDRPVVLIPIAQLEPNACVMVASGVGAPGAGKALVNPEHSITAARDLVRLAGHLPHGVIPGHVPGMYAWLVAGVLQLPLVDAACNGRGHPTVRMGSLGLSSRPEVQFHQCGAGDNVRISVHGNTLVTSHLMRAAAVQNGGLIMAARGYFDASLIREQGALGAISYQLALGRQIAAAGTSGQARFDAAVSSTRGRALAVGVVVSNSVVYRDGFDVGEVTVRCDLTGDEVVFGVCNEFMTADCGDRRLATFPDLIAAMDPVTGEVLAISELTVGKEVATLGASKRGLPMGKGILDPSIYPDVERSMNKDLSAYALDANA